MVQTGADLMKPCPTEIQDKGKPMAIEPKSGLTIVWAETKVAAAVRAAVSAGAKTYRRYLFNIDTS
jgi:hypothetical protein